MKYIARCPNPKCKGKTVTRFETKEDTIDERILDIQCPVCKHMMKVYLLVGDHEYEIGGNIE